jgi:hypothetical protein
MESKCPKCGLVSNADVISVADNSAITGFGVTFKCGHFFSLLLLSDIDTLKGYVGELRMKVADLEKKIKIQS